MSNATYRAFPEKLGGSDSTQFVGDRGELFWDPENANLSISDGETPGGIGIKTRNLQASYSNLDYSQWVTLFGNTASDWKAYYGSASATDSNGNLWVTGGYDGYGVRATLGCIYREVGYFEDNWRFVGQDSDYIQYGESIAIHKDSENGDRIYVLITTANGNQEILLAAINPNDITTPYWIKQINGSGQERATDVFVDDAGNIYVSGSTQDSTANPGNRDGFIAKFLPNGTCVWKKTLGGSGSDRLEGLTVASGYLYVVGRTDSSGQGGNDAFIAKLNPGVGLAEPTIVWQKTLGRPTSGSWEYGFGITVAQSGNVYVTGEAYNPEDIWNHQIYVAKLSSTGALVWNKYFNDYDYSFGSALALDTEENIYLSGYAYIDFPIFEQTFYPQNNDLIIAKIASDGELKYIKSLGTKYEEGLKYHYGHRSITYSDERDYVGCGFFSPGEYLYITGYTKNIDRNNPNGFVAKLKADGEFEGVYGDFIAQQISLEYAGYGDSNLVVTDADLTLDTASNITVGINTTTVQQYSEDAKTSPRSPFEIRVRGAIVADTTLTRDLTVNGYPFANTDGVYDNNLCIGAGAGSNHNGASDNIYLGYLSGFRNESGDQNIYLGTYAGNRNLNGNNVFVGYRAGENSTQGTNTFVGSYAADEQYSGTGNVAIGYNINLDDSNGSNQLKIGSNGDFWIKGDSNRNVTVKNDLKFETNGTGIYMKDANGVTWQILVSVGGTLGISSTF